MSQRKPREGPRTRPSMLCCVHTPPFMRSMRTPFSASPVPRSALASAPCIQSHDSPSCSMRPASSACSARLFPRTLGSLPLLLWCFSSSSSFPFACACPLGRAIEEEPLASRSCHARSSYRRHGQSLRLLSAVYALRSALRVAYGSAVSSMRRSVECTHPAPALAGALEHRIKRKVADRHRVPAVQARGAALPSGRQMG